MTYKIGDKIRLKEKIWFLHDHKAGDILTLEKRCSEKGWDTSPSGYYREDEFELVEPEPEPETKPCPLNVGDKVRIIGNEIRPHRVGDIGVIVQAGSTCARVGVNGESWWYDYEDLKEFSPDLKVGDKVRLTGRYMGHDAGTVVTIHEVDDKDPEIPYLLKLPNGGTSWAVARRVEAIPVESPTAPDLGMSPDGLADFFEGFIRAAKSRITGVGAEQYSGNGSQKFEHMSVAELIEYAREEVQDIAVYGAMLDVRLQRVLSALNSKGISVVNL